MLKGIEFAEERIYDQEDGINHPYRFFIDSFSQSSRLDLLLGYFTLSSLNVLSYGFASFIKNGGILRVVLNEFVKVDDIDIIVEGENIEISNEINLYEDLDILKKVLSKPDKHFFECIAWLIANNRIQFQFIRMKVRGIPHNKNGIFYDSTNNRVGFTGSCNFTGSGILYNMENVLAILDWDSDISKRQIDKYENSFNKYFNKESNNVEYLDSKKVKENIEKTFGNKELEQILEDEKELLDNFKKELEENYINRINDDQLNILEENYPTPSFPFNSNPRAYQSQAYENWVSNNYKGIFAMATGTGKTITSLNCLLENYKKNGNYKALILVPTISLVSQWIKECKKFNFQENLIKVYSLNNWQAELSRLTTMKLLNKEFSYVIIATYSSFLTKKFQDHLITLSEETLLIADECHNMGSKSIMKKLKTFHLKNRIGLSATPERQFQEEVNSEIRNFFGEENENNYTFSYTMYDAIKKEPRALCPYRYYPKIVRLTDSEFKKYEDYSKQIIRFHPKNDEEKERFNRLCIARQRIIHKAEKKLDVFKSILLEEYTKRKNLKYTLVYVAEGLAEEDIEFDATRSDILNETDSDLNLLNLYTRTIGELFDNVSVKQFIGTTSSEDRKTILDDFASGSLQVITSMKCLDEGIDVPRSELAIFCASTGNPRQFIQRRGRVLRLAEGKDEAVIYDLVVVPEPSGDISLFKIEQSEIEKELRRVRDFAEMSENIHYTRQILDPLLIHYQLKL
jgi:superfamily II DNA or RNA helicase